jgi:hypothetical protein
VLEHDHFGHLRPNRLGARTVIELLFSIPQPSMDDSLHPFAAMKSVNSEVRHRFASAIEALRTLSEVSTAA